MQLVTFMTDMRPWRAGDRVPVPDDVAATLLAAGEASDPSPWPPAEGVARTAATKPAKGYRTKG